MDVGLVHIELFLERERDIQREGERERGREREKERERERERRESCFVEASSAQHPHGSSITCIAQPVLSPAMKKSLTFVKYIGG